MASTAIFTYPGATLSKEIELPMPTNPFESNLAQRKKAQLMRNSLQAKHKQLGDHLYKLFVTAQAQQQVVNAFSIETRVQT